MEELKFTKTFDKALILSFDVLLTVSLPVVMLLFKVMVKVSNPHYDVCTKNALVRERYPLIIEKPKLKQAL